MIKKIIRLVKPGLFLPSFEFDSENEDSVLVRPRYLSICAADQRYFRGNRPQEVLKKKLPMALIHEATGEVLYDPKDEFQVGQPVVLLPYPVYDDPLSNYKHNTPFRSSSMDGFCQEMLYMSRSELIAIPAQHSEHYVFAELLSVCCHAIRRIKRLTALDCLTVGIWGDGVMGQTLALAIRALEPRWQLCVLGRHDEKLAMLPIGIQKINTLEGTSLPAFDIAFECVGGEKAENAINQIIQAIKPCSYISLLGVTEQPPRLCTRSILEKGITLVGNSRSQKEDFIKSVEVMNEKSILPALERLISSKHIVTNYLELCEAFITDKQCQFKTLINLQI